MLNTTPGWQGSSRAWEKPVTSEEGHQGYAGPWPAQVWKSVNPPRVSRGLQSPLSLQTPENSYPHRGHYLELPKYMVPFYALFSLSLSLCLECPFHPSPPFCIHPLRWLNYFHLKKSPHSTSIPGKTGRRFAWFPEPPSVVPPPPLGPSSHILPS